MNPATTETPVTLTLTRLVVHDFMRVEALTIEANGQHVRISGPNASGKTSAVQAIWAALQNCSRRIAEPVRRGADKAVIELDLGEYRVERTYAAGKTTLVVTAADGSRVHKPQALLDSLLADLTLDPVSFLAQRPQDQIETILGATRVQPPEHEVRELTGEEAPAKPNESAESYLQRLCGDDVGTWYLRRRDAARDLDQQHAAIEAQRKRLAEMGGPEGSVAGGETPSVILAEIDQLQAAAEDRRLALSSARESQAKHDEARRLLETIETQAAEERGTCDDLVAEISRLTDQLHARMAKVGALEGRFAKGQDVVGQLASLALADRERAEAMPDLSVRVAEMRGRLQVAQESASAVAKQRAIREEVARLAAGIQAATKEAKRINDVLGGLRQLRGQLLDDVDLGVPGLSVGQGELLLDGVPFAQASAAQRIRVACAIATLQEPRLRILRVDEGERLDADSEQALLQWADAHGFQIIETRVSQDKDLKIEIVEAKHGEE